MKIFDFLIDGLSSFERLNLVRTEAFSAVVGHDRRDRLMRNKVRPRKVVKNFE